MKKYAGALIAGLFLIGAGCSGEKPNPGEGSGFRGIVTRPAKQVSAVSLREAGSGKKVSLKASPGKFRLAYFGYLSCPDVCPTSMADLKQAMEKQPKADQGKLTPSFITVDAGRDTEQKLQEYMKLFFPASQNFRPQRQELKQAEREFGADSRIGKKNRQGEYEVSHSAYIYLVDDQGRVVVEWPFGTSSEDISQDISKALKGVQ